jgi:hypothetical protein
VLVATAFAALPPVARGAEAETVEVVNTSDSGAGSLRAAIDYANAHPGTQVAFHIPLIDSGYADGVFTIRPTAALPVLSATSANLDGSTQTAFTGDTNPVGPEVVLNGALAGSATSGIEITGSACLIRALVVNGFAQSGVLVSSGPGGHRIEACYVGTDPTGMVALPNATGTDDQAGVSVNSGAATVVGGTSPGAGNLLSGNSVGIGVYGATTTGTRIEGNLIGTDRAGTGALGNSVAGVYLHACGPDTVVGGEVAAARNVISGNQQSGVSITDVTAAGTVVAANYIGTDCTGALRLANLLHGVYLWGSRDVTIGGATTGRRNIISGNYWHGVFLFGSDVRSSVLGNYIGTDVTGTVAIPNSWAQVTSAGVYLRDARYNQIGGPGPGEGNLISGNAVFGITLDWASYNAVQGNRIGTNAAGTAALPNQVFGVYIPNGTYNQVGGTAAGTGNLVSGNALSGVYIEAGNVNTVKGNWIGVDASGTAALGNGDDGVKIVSSRYGHWIGGTEPGAGNVIRFNTAHGISIVDASTANRLLGNTLSANGLLGIDLGEDGVTANDPGDGDTGANQLMNYPVILAAGATATELLVSGTLDASNPPTCRLEFFASDARDPSGYGEGQTYLGNGTPAADGTFTVTLSTVVSFGTWVTATATDADGNTSEFALCVAVTVTDGDSLPNDWEVHWFGNLNQGSDDDPDSDGFTNGQEYAVGTNPTDAASTPVYSWTNVAGQPSEWGPDAGTGSAARFNQPCGVAVDAAGNVYVAARNDHVIQKVTATGVATILAGSPGSPGSADGTGSAARFHGPRGVAVDSAGNVYVADTDNYTVRKVTPAGVVTTLAGSPGNPGSADGTGSAARFSGSAQLAVDSAGNVLATDSNNHTIRKVTPAGVVSTLAGSPGAQGSADGTGSAARFAAPYGVAVGSAGNVFVADTGNHTIRKVTPAGVVTTLAGSPIAINLRSPYRRVQRRRSAWRGPLLACPQALACACVWSSCTIWPCPG